MLVLTGCSGSSDADGSDASATSAEAAGAARELSGADTAAEAAVDTQEQPVSAVTCSPSVR